MLEDTLQRQCAAHLRMALVAPWSFYHVPNGFHVRGGDRRAAQREMAKLKAMGLKPGVADLVITGPRDHASGGLLYAELKSATGSLTAEQKAWRAHAQETGRPFATVRSLDALEAFLVEQRVPLRLRLSRSCVPSGSPPAQTRAGAQKAGA